MNFVHVNPKQGMLVAIAAVSALVSGCAATTPPTSQPNPTPAGYADGTKTVDTANLIFSSTSKGLAYDSSGVTGLADFPVVFQTTSDPNVIIATVSGQQITLNWDAGTSVFSGANGTYAVEATGGVVSDDGQVVMGAFDVQGPGGTGNAGFYAAGLETDPAQIATLAGNGGTANYAGPVLLLIDHGGINNRGIGSGTVALSADFGAGTVGGTMNIIDAGSDAGFEISNGTIITVNPATISGNAFSGTWSANAANLSMTSIGTTNIAGNFYGVDAFDIGGSFNGTGVSADGSTPATITGGFFGQ